MLNKILIGVGMVVVLGLMGAGVAYAVSGTQGDGRAGEGNSGRWQVPEASARGGRWLDEEAEVNGGAAEAGGGRRQTAQAGGQGGRWSSEGGEVNDSRTVPQSPESLSGVVLSLDGTLLVLETDGHVMEASLGQSGYWEAQGISLTAGDKVLVEGCYEGGDATLEVRSITLVSTGQTVVLRDGSGRPMWAGGRWNSGAGTGPAF